MPQRACRYRLKTSVGLGIHWLLSSLFQNAFPSNHTLSIARPTRSASNCFTHSGPKMALQGRNLHSPVNAWTPVSRIHAPVSFVALGSQKRTPFEPTLNGPDQRPGQRLATS